MRMNDLPESSNADARTYGVLATRLTAALGTARAALAPHGAQVPKGTLANLDALLDELARRRIQVAIYGEVKAGKSTLLNAIAGSALSPVAFEPLTSVPVHVTYGPITAWRVGDRRLASVAELEQLMRSGDGASTPVVAETNLDLLQLGGQVDFVDTPGVGSDDRLDAVTAGALRALDAVVLVVRYPALFTQFTQRLVEGLDADVSKLFVVWNLDAACTELSPAERERHAESLRAHVAGAHELFVLDARFGLGLDGFIAALRRFVSSGGRDVAAIREAAKRGHLQLTGAQQMLSERHTDLERTLAEARQQLDATQATATVAEAAARTRYTDFEAAVAGIAQAGAATATQLAAALTTQLRAARRRWIRTADLAALDSAVTDALQRYADAVEGACQSTHAALHSAAADFDSSLPAAPRPRTPLATEPWTPDDRRDRATSGRWRVLRRALFRRWYLPGLTTLERVAIGEDLKAQAAWRDTTVAAAVKDANDTLARHLADIAQRAAGEARAIKTATNYDERDAEATRLRRDLPVVADQIAAITAIATEARAVVPA
jgi:hypothetical protein